MLLLLLLPLASAENLLPSIPQKDAFVDRTFLDFKETVKYDNKGEVEEHFVPTEDGKPFLWQIPLVASYITGGHGGIDFYATYATANSFIILGEGCQCYEYLKQGYDVWVANSRGNRYSRNHTTLNPDRDAKFWNYGLLEMALYYVPAVLNYIIKVTGFPQLVYVCHSQGCTILMILCACRPEYNALVSVAFGQSPTCYLENSKTPLLELEALLTPGLLAAKRFGKHKEIITYRGLLSSLAMALCAISNIPCPVCMLPVYVLFGYNGEEISKYALQDTVGKEPSGTSSDIFAEWGFIKQHGFKMLNGTEYCLEKVTLKWCFCVSENDYVAHLKDVMTMLKRLLNSKFEVCVLKDKSYGHLDHVSGVHSPLFDAGWVITCLAKGNMEGCVGRAVTSPNTDLLSTS